MGVLAPKALGREGRTIYLIRVLYIRRISCTNSAIFEGGWVIELWL
jgi:hypothetical protein